MSTETTYYNLTIIQVAEKLNTSPENGLSKEEAKKRLVIYGYNEFEKKKKKGIFYRFMQQFKSFMIIVLLIAAIISGIVGYMHGEGFTDAIIILFIVILNAVIGTVQETKAEQSLEALEKMSAPHCKVTRDGQTEIIESRELVPGDLVTLDTGDSIPADLRLIEAINLKIQDSALTGESVPEEKFTEVIEQENVPLGDRDNLGFSSSIVTYGRGKGIVTGTGMNTEVGKIAAMIQSAPETQTPLQEKLDKLGKFLGIGALIICIILFIVGVLYGKNMMDMFMTAVSLAAAAIPEGLPAVSTIVLAVGVQRLVKKNAIVRTLPAVETLGSTTVICSDKTGTLTQNRMTVVKIYVNGSILDISKETGESNNETDALWRSSILANDAKLSYDHNSWKTLGDPTETALLDGGIKYRLIKGELESKFPRVAEIPFDSERKMMTTVNKDENGSLNIYTKGGLDEVLSCCDHILINGQVKALTEEMKTEIRKANTDMAEKALRVLASAMKKIPELPDKVAPSTLEKNLIFIGMLGMIDPPREEVKEAVEKCRTAGIKPVMITGDHKITAKAIAMDLGILNPGEESRTGADVEQMPDDELLKNIHSIAVYARVSPEDKVRIVKAFQQSGEIVAMTGDGVNDAPALKLADIGCAMGITGTDVSKEAADIVLTDDNFATVVTAVEEGRRIYNNILKAIQFMLSTNIGEIVVLFLAVLVNWVSPLLPIHILWINLVTDSLPALSLSVDPADSDIMKRKPVDSKQAIMNKVFATRIFLQGTMIGILSLTAYVIGMYTSNDVRNLGFTDFISQMSSLPNVMAAQTMTFAVL
ncbi:MAG: calcium-translocating P-type ATPase, PMCA-type, partial [Dysgonamonadaceae bacterium]|nr:calcium-translocating P-type ATPase, PMCA-type [Dysgonamonadaceae bacterium]